MAKTWHISSSDWLIRARDDAWPNANTRETRHESYRNVRAARLSELVLTISDASSSPWSGFPPLTKIQWDNKLRKISSTISFRCASYWPYKPASRAKLERFNRSGQTESHNREGPRGKNVAELLLCSLYFNKVENDECISFRKIGIVRRFGSRSIFCPVVRQYKGTVSPTSVSLITRLSVNRFGWNRTRLHSMPISWLVRKPTHSHAKFHNCFSENPSWWFVARPLSRLDKTVYFNNHITLYHIFHEPDRGQF